MRKKAMNLLILFCLQAVFVYAANAADAAGNGESELFVKKATLLDTMLVTKERYTNWLADQKSASAEVTCGPWFLSKAGLIPEKSIDLTAKDKEGKPLWMQQSKWKDGNIVVVSQDDSSAASFLICRTITARKPVTLTAGLGGGDQLDVWLNGKSLLSKNTTLTYDRYGTGEITDGTRRDQVLLDLPLVAGENQLTVKLRQAGVSLRRRLEFYFSIAPDPVSRLWAKIRKDFPPATNRLLELAKHDWFETGGWLSAAGKKLEQRMIMNCSRGIADYDDDGKMPVVDSSAPSLGLCITATELFAVRQDLQKLRSAVAELAGLFPRDYPGNDFLRRLDDLEKRLILKAVSYLAPDDETITELARLKREMLVSANPLLRNTELLFIKRYTYNSKHYYDDFQHVSRWGGNLYVLSLSDGRIRQMAPQLDGGVFDSYDLSFDARRIVFGYRRPKPEGFRIYEIGIDGSGLRQVIQPPADEDRQIAAYGKTSFGDGFYGLMGYRFWTDDVHPCYLPDGGFCFASTRCQHGVLCTPNHYLACTTLFRCDADGSEVRPISQGMLSEFTPTMMEDGRILYNRWEYVYKGIAAVQPLWVMRPDGSGSEEFYGDNVANPGVFWQARQIPGNPRLAVCIGCGHEPMGVGQVLLLDMNKNKRTIEPMTSLTPDTRTQGLRGLYQRRNGRWKEDVYGPLYRDPYPLSDPAGRGAGKFFLVSCNPDKRYNDQSAYGIYLLDVFGNRVPVYSDPEISCWQPMSLRPRKRPPVLPPLAKNVTGSENNTTPISQSSGKAVATMFVNDVYRGLDGVKPGTVKYLRVMEQVPKPWAAELDQSRGEDRTADGFGGQLVISYCAHIWVAVLHGIVQVEKDGSACFEVPARRNLFFQALDENFMEVQRMRTFINVESGEQRSCIGCHEQRIQAPVSRKAVALVRKPVILAAQPGEVAPRPLYYPTDIQPMLNRNCIRCHSGSEPKAKLDLSGELTTLFNRSYENLLARNMANYICEWGLPPYKAGAPERGSMANVEATPPYTYGSHKSKLIEMLRTGHHDVKLSREEFIKLVTWIDSGVPFYGSYYGRRNIKYQGAPDFRPVPTVESAQGIPPPPCVLSSAVLSPQIK
ncbi:MAG: hypothetical protein PHR77_03535 [Kiritimatiellae bacterium]|nr:hypothetical protein [Kiritimatiellia bacterium]MDD5522043.1 hypothetical protein [Kiritimatiellia bacterium]